MNVASLTGGSTTPYPMANLSEMQGDVSAYAQMIAQLYPAQEYRSRNEINAQDAALAKFKEDLKVKGAALFLQELNEEKIEALVEEYRQKLMKLKEENPEQPIDVNQMVSDFRKQLLKELTEAQKAEQSQKSSAAADPMMSADLLENIKTTKAKEKTALQGEEGFLEKMLSPQTQEKEKRPVFNL
ncbi:MAG: hypothetical protein RBS26_07205 [Sulfuricurvum sp.]|jgi:uncharacterized protein with von Willebrand factor type A (vWA) domain|nr:hypothetical protein [Sulfuricurvum sp.]